MLLTVRPAIKALAYLFAKNRRRGRTVLTWTFYNIILPDSTTDEPNSHGFIQFLIRPKHDLPDKTAVENLAIIFSKTATAPTA